MIDSPFQVVEGIFLGISLVTEHPRLIGKRVQGQCSMYFSNNWMSSEITIRRLTLFMTTCRRISSFHLFGETSSAILDTKTTTRELITLFSASYYKSLYSGVKSLLGNTPTNIQFNDIKMHVLVSWQRLQCRGVWLNTGIQLHYQGDLPNFKSVSSRLASHFSGVRLYFKVNTPRLVSFNFPRHT